MGWDEVMSIAITKHARMRMQQRGITHERVTRCLTSGTWVRDKYHVRHDNMIVVLNKKKTAVNTITDTVVTNRRMTAQQEERLTYDLGVLAIYNTRAATYDLFGSHMNVTRAKCWILNKTTPYL